MPNPKAIVKASEFDPTRLIFGTPRPLLKGGKFGPVSYGPDKQRVYLQTPNLSCPFGVGVYDDPRTGEKSYSIDVAFKDLADPQTKAFYDTMLGLNHVTLTKAVERSKEWFGKPMSKEVLDEIYRPLIKHPKDPKYSPTLKIKIPDKGVPTPEFYNEAKELVALDCITKGSRITCILELSPVWFVNKTFRLTWKLVQAVVTSASGPQKFKGYAFLKKRKNMKTRPRADVSCTSRWFPGVEKTKD